jgi:serine protease
MASRNPALTPAGITALLKSTARPFTTDGADNLLGIPVRSCDQPNRFSPNDPDNFGLDAQCYCTTTTCGAGMLDAGAAVQAAAVGAAAGTGLNIGLRVADPAAGDTLQFYVSGLGAAATAVSHRWQLLDGGGAASGFSGATNAATAALPTTAGGTVRVRLSVVDNLGVSRSETLSVVVRGTGAGGGTGGGGSTGGGTAGSGGGGAMSAPWLAGLALAVALLSVHRRRA